MISLLSGILTAFFGWTGGRGDDYWKSHPKWPRWLLQSWTRDYIIGPVCAITALMLGVHSWWLVALCITTGLALSTYWDFLFGYDNFYMYGFMIGLASFPVAIVTGHWWMLIIRSVFLCVWMGLWSRTFDDANVEDLGRYFPIGATIFMII